MGNSAMKCCRCKGRTVSVLLWSGEVVVFKEPVTAATVMKIYRQHVVLHCNRGTGRQRICVLKPEQALKSSQNYVVTPIQTGGNDKTRLDSWALLTVTANKKLNAKIKRKTHRSSPNTRSWIQRVFDKIFRFSQSFHSLDDDEYIRPLLCYNQPAVEYRKSSESQDWRPSVECIPECCSEW